MFIIKIFPFTLLIFYFKMSATIWIATLFNTLVTIGNQPSIGAKVCAYHRLRLINCSTLTMKARFRGYPDCNWQNENPRRWSTTVYFDKKNHNYLCCNDKLLIQEVVFIEILKSLLSIRFKLFLCRNIVYYTYNIIKTKNNDFIWGQCLHSVL